MYFCLSMHVFNLRILELQKCMDICMFLLDHLWRYHKNLKPAAQKIVEVKGLEDGKKNSIS